MKTSKRLQKQPAKEPPKDPLSELKGGRFAKIYRSEFAARCRELAEEFGSVNNLASAASIPEPTLRSYTSEKSEPTRERLIILAWNAGVNVEWLVTGLGPKYVDDSAPRSRHVSRDELEGDYVLVPRLDVRAAAGAGSLVESEQVVDYLAFKADWVRRDLRVSPDNLVLISAMGDSMEPAIHDGDLLLIDTSVDQVRDDAIYVLAREGEIVVKRIQKLLDGAVIVRSDNPAYVEQTLGPGQAQDLRVAGRVRWIAKSI